MPLLIIDIGFIIYILSLITIIDLAVYVGVWIKRRFRRQGSVSLNIIEKQGVHAMTDTGMAANVAGFLILLALLLTGMWFLGQAALSSSFASYQIVGRISVVVVSATEILVLVAGVFANGSDIVGVKGLPWYVPTGLFYREFYLRILWKGGWVGNTYNILWAALMISLGLLPVALAVRFLT